MTRIEKQIIINALVVYQDHNKKLEDVAREHGKLEEAKNLLSERIIASGLVEVFRDILNEKAGSVKI